MNKILIAAPQLQSSRIAPKVRATSKEIKQELENYHTTMMELYKQKHALELLQLQKKQQLELIRYRNQTFGSNFITKKKEGTK